MGAILAGAGNLSRGMTDRHSESYMHESICVSYKLIPFMRTLAASKIDSMSSALRLS